MSDYEDNLIEIHLNAYTKSLITENFIFENSKLRIKNYFSINTLEIKILNVLVSKISNFIKQANKGLWDRIFLDRYFDFQDITSVKVIGVIFDENYTNPETVFNNSYNHLNVNLDFLTSHSFFNFQLDKSKIKSEIEETFCYKELEKNLELTNILKDLTIAYKDNLPLTIQEIVLFNLLYKKISSILFKLPKISWDSRHLYVLPSLSSPSKTLLGEDSILLDSLNIVTMKVSHYNSLNYEGINYDHVKFDIPYFKRKQLYNTRDCALDGDYLDAIEAYKNNIITKQDDFDFDLFYIVNLENQCHIQTKEDSNDALRLDLIDERI